MVDASTIAKVTGASEKLATKYAGDINQAMSQFDINTPARALAFLSQIGHESSGLKYREELASGDAYDTRTDLGNTPQVDGDGKKYKGRGFIQITGHANYEKVGKALGKDFVNDPAALAEPKYAALASAWWWKNRGLNEVADKIDVSKDLTDAKNLEVFREITKKINGGYNGLTDRINRFTGGRLALVEAWVKKNPGKTAAGGALFLGIVVFILIAVASKKTKS